MQINRQQKVRALAIGLAFLLYEISPFLLRKEDQRNDMGKPEYRPRSACLI
jgi:hypothetical protein